MEDDNQAIIDTIRTYVNKDWLLGLLIERLEFGRKKYGHGVRIDSTKLNDYNNNWTDSIKQMDWASMMLEEAMDGMVYITAEILRIGEDHPDVAVLKEALSHMVKSAEIMFTYHLEHSLYPSREQLLQ